MTNRMPQLRRARRRRQRQRLPDIPSPGGSTVHRRDMLVARPIAFLHRANPVWQSGDESRPHERHRHGVGRLLRWAQELSRRREDQQPTLSWKISLAHTPYASPPLLHQCPKLLSVPCIVWTSRLPWSAVLPDNVESFLRFSPATFSVKTLSMSQVVCVEAIASDSPERRRHARVPRFEGAAAPFRRSPAIGLGLSLQAGSIAVAVCVHASSHAR